MKKHLVRCIVSVFMLIAISSIAQVADIRQGLVAYWQMEDTDGFTTLDATPFNNHLSVVDMSSGNFVPGQFGNAAQFNGSSTYMLNLHSPDPSISGLPIYRAGSYTITMWVKGAAQTAKYLYSEGSTVNNAPLLILQTGQAAANNNKLDVIIRPDAGAALVNHVVSSTVVFDDNWHHIAWVDDRGSVRLYIDGNLDSANFNYTPSGTFTMDTTAIGTLVRAAVSTGAIFPGLIDDVAVWKRALSEAEVQEVRTSSLMTPIPEFPAMIVGQPRGSTNQVGDRVTFSATAEGGPPLGYQWFKNGVELPEAMAASLTLSNLIADDSGDYTVQVTNRFGTNLSSAATLLVLPDPPPDLPLGIVSYWSLDEQLEDESARATFRDPYSSGDFKVFANNTFLDQIAGVLGSAAVFNGIEQYAYREGGFPAHGPLAYSVAFWVNAVGAGQNDRRIFAESSTNNPVAAFSLGTQITGANGTMRVLIQNNSGTPLLDRHSSRTVLDGAWHHVAWTETNGEARLYIDGTLDETSFNYTRNAVSLDTTTLGASLRAGGPTNFFSGVIDEVGVWSRALSFAEIQQILFDGIPAPVSGIAPAITLQPGSQSVFTRANVLFNFAASGTAPLSFQWRKNGDNLEGETNGALSLTNVVLAEAGDYDVVVTNALGSVTSQVATLTVTLRPTTTDLKVDFNNLGADDAAGNTEPGFASFALPIPVTPGPVTRVFGGAEVTLSAVGGINMESRRRAQPANTPTFTDERLLQDFIFARDAVLDQGMDIRIDFLEPNQTYAATVWSYDNGSTGDRISDWFANGETVTNGYVLNGVNLPADNTTFRFSFSATTDPAGTILIQGRRSPLAAGGINVFINALQVTALVAGELRVQAIELVPPASLRLTFSAISATATHHVEEKINVDDPTWTAVAGAVFGPPNDSTIEVTLPVPATATRFYRVVETPAP